MFRNVNKHVMFYAIKMLEIYERKIVSQCNIINNNDLSKLDLIICLRSLDKLIILR